MVFGTVNVAQLSSNLLRDAMLISPELILATTIPVLLLCKIFQFGRAAIVTPVVLVAVSLASWQCLQLETRSYGGQFIFDGMLVIDEFGRCFRLMLLGFVFLLTLLGTLTKSPASEDLVDFYTLILGSTLGLMLMSSTNHLLMAFVAIEMASLPSYALTGFSRKNRSASEASLKYVIYGAAASGTMLYGISLVVGTFGTGSLPTIALKISTQQLYTPVSGFVGILFILGGLLFKLSAVPLHFWTPDVFEGTSAEFAAFLSIASKAGAMVLSARLMYQLSGLAIPFTNMVGVMWAVLAAVTMTWGNLAAYGQTNVKRLLAYSTIAHAGLMMTAVTIFDYRTAAPLMFYILSYLLMNLGAFAVVAFVRQGTDSEELETYDGLAVRSPILAGALTIFVLSLLGLPPLAGFAAKFQIFIHLAENARNYSVTELYMLMWVYYAMLIVVGFNTVLSAGYYVNIIRRMYLEPTVQAHRPIAVSFGGRVYLSALVGGVIALGLWWTPILDAGKQAGRSFQAKSVKDQRNELGMP